MVMMTPLIVCPFKKKNSLILITRIDSIIVLQPAIIIIVINKPAKT